MLKHLKIQSLVYNAFNNSGQEWCENDKELGIIHTVIFSQASNIQKVYCLIILESSSEPQFPFIHSLWSATKSSKANNLYRLLALKYWVFKREISHVFSIHILIHDDNSHHTYTSTKPNVLLNMWSEGGSYRRNESTRKHQTWFF